MKEKLNNTTADVIRALGASVRQEPGYDDLATENTRLNYVNQNARGALRMCIAELEMWMKVYGADIESLTAVDEAKSALRLLR